MNEDYRYECALAAALVILDFLDGATGAPKHELLTKTTLSILHAMDRYNEAKGDRHVGFSVN
jgi:hypothetical protein